MLKKIQKIVLSPLFIIALILLSLVLRRFSLPVITHDMLDGLFDWYGFILKRGFINAFKENFALYTPAYLYLLALATLIDGIVSRVTLIKLISIAFDIFSAFFVYKITRIKYPKTNEPFLAGALTFILPTVVINSAYWGQCDSIYTAFLLGCIYFLLTERPAWAMLFFSTAFAFKLQAIFLLPFLAVYTLRKRIPWLSYLLIPAVYIAFAVPTIIAGRPWEDVMTIYAHQTGKFPKWSSTTPTLYLILQGRVPLTSTLSMLVVIFAGVIVSIWIFLVWKKRTGDNHNSILLTALASVALVPYILPRMHQRYFYPQDVIALVVAFFQPQLWFLPILSQVISVIAYGPYLLEHNSYIQIFGRNLNILYWVALPAETFLLAFVLWKQFRRQKNNEERATDKAGAESTG